MLNVGIIISYFYSITYVSHVSIYFKVISFVKAFEKEMALTSLVMNMAARKAFIV